MGPVRLTGWGAAAISLAAAVGLVVGMRAVAELTTAGPVAFLSPLTLPLEGLGIPWSTSAVMPAALQLVAFEALVRMLGLLVLATASLGVVNASLTLAEAAASRIRELAIRFALGASLPRIVVDLLRELRVLLGASVLLGLLLGVFGGMAVRAAWPQEAAAWVTRAPFDTLLLIGVILLAAAGSHLLGASGAGRPRRRLAALRGGARAGEDPAGIFLRRVLHGTHIAVVGTVLVMAWTLLEVGRTDGETSGEDGVVVMAARGDPGTDWGPILQELGALAGVQAESLAAPGALQGLGIRDMVITECGACSRGGLPSPLWNARADHHAVGPGFFDLTGQRVVQGRPFSRLDGRNARRVALINEELANTAFEGGRPLGKKIRVGSDFDAWYTVIGVVAEETPPALGRDGHRRSAVYLNALQHPLGSARVLVRGGEDGVRAARALLAREGLAPGEPLPTGAFLRAEAGPLVWGLALARALGGLTLLLAVHGIGVATLQSARRRARDVAVRRAVGASTGAILRHTLTETLRTTGWGLAGFAFFATLTVALLESSTGLEGPGPGAWSVLAGGLVALSVLASARAALEATRVQPGTLLK